MVNYKRLQRLIHKQLRDFGGGEETATLRRDGEDRACTVVILNQSNKSSDLGTANDRRVLVSALDLDPAPSIDDSIILADGVERRIVEPPQPLAPDGVTVLFYELIARL